MRRFNLEVLLVALIALALLITWLFSTWEAFQKSVLMFPAVQLLPLTGVFTARIFLTRTALLAGLLGRRCGFYLGPSFLGKPQAYKSSRFPTLLLQHCVSPYTQSTYCTRQGSNLQSCDPKLLGGAPNAGVRDSLHQSVKLTSNASAPTEEAKPSVWPARYMTTPFPLASLACICPSIRVSPRLTPW